jgi:hypothetical protein
MHEERQQERVTTRRDPLVTFFGGSPGGVIVRLIVLSLFVGFVMTWLGLSPNDLLRSAERLFRDAWFNSADMFRSILAYTLTGAAVVIPIWLLMRVFSVGRRR